MNKLEFKDGYIILNDDDTTTICGACAHTYFHTFYKTCREANINLEETNKMYINSIKELLTR